MKRRYENTHVYAFWNIDISLDILDPEIFLKFKRILKFEKCLSTDLDETCRV